MPTQDSCSFVLVLHSVAQVHLDHQLWAKDGMLRRTGLVLHDESQSLFYLQQHSSCALSHKSLSKLSCAFSFTYLHTPVQAAVEAVERKMPKRLKRKRKIQTEDGLDAGMEEYYDYVFPEEAGAAPNLKLLEAAQAWKRRKQMEATEDGVS